MSASFIALDAHRQELGVVEAYCYFCGSPGEPLPEGFDCNLRVRAPDGREAWLSGVVSPAARSLEALVGARFELEYDDFDRCAGLLLGLGDHCAMPLDYDHAFEIAAHAEGVVVRGELVVGCEPIAEGAEYVERALALSLVVREMIFHPNTPPE